METTKQKMQGQPAECTSSQGLLAGCNGESSHSTTRQFPGTKHQHSNDNSDADSTFADAAVLKAAKLIAQGKKVVSSIFPSSNH
jgi:hypothetical protein